MSLRRILKMATSEISMTGSHTWKAAAAMSLLGGLCLIPAEAVATSPPRADSTAIPPHIAQRLRDIQVTTRGYLNLTRTVRANRSAAKAGIMLAAGASSALKIAGQKSIPVLMATFKNTASDPYPIANLQRQLFDGPWPTGTMTDYYREISYGALTVTGTAHPWKKLDRADHFYKGSFPSGGETCNGLCDTARMGEFLKDALDKYGDQIDWTKYDNNGPDGIPNSGDDDGFVDFVAFVHPDFGGECQTPGQVNNNIWSHRATYAGWFAGSNYETKSVGRNGQNIKINDYVIMPALACDKTTMIQIGVFAHEFGHAFGLPDLYDTRDADGTSEGIGNWGLMGAGSWGGDNETPARPSHMSAWEKEKLGWVDPVEVTSDRVVELRPVGTHPDVVKVRISEDEYYLLEYRRKIGFDVSLTESGLLIWRINDEVLQAGMANNTVNADETRKGVGLVEADGAGDLDRGRNRADAGDIFPTGSKRKLDKTTNPASVGRVAFCDISDAGATMKVKVQVSSQTCN
jgi:M6 family metalloprotease-like protein